MIVLKYEFCSYSINNYNISKNLKYLFLKNQNHIICLERFKERSDAKLQGLRNERI